MGKPHAEYNQSRLTYLNPLTSWSVNQTLRNSDFMASFWYEWMDHGAQGGHLNSQESVEKASPAEGRAGESYHRHTGRPRQGFKITKGLYAVTDTSHLHF